MFIDLSNKRIMWLPDDYEVEDSDLDDIKYNLDPSYNQAAFDTIENVHKSRGLDGTQYYPGYIGLNNLGKIYISLAHNHRFI